MPFEQISEALWGTSLERTLVARHQAMDDKARTWLNRHPEDRCAFIELPCGLATRSRRLASSCPGQPVSWIEADLPAMMDARQKLLGSSPRVQSIPVNALEWEGRTGLARLADAIQARHLCVTMEGLLNYLGIDGIRQALAMQRKMLDYTGQDLTLIADIWPDLRHQPLGPMRHIPARILKTLTGSEAGLLGKSADEIRGWFIEAGFEAVTLYTLDGEVCQSLDMTPAPWCILVEAYAKAGVR
ncbi:hypothetical protein AAIA72_03430 [Hahella sp. SMD15-11]|uniref:Class I SAM-dependent methyltransferase n=1 Tax=Thermohahella caldifontis TaxID=3142973 RepID=A0AB39UZ35_9GAMM